MSKYVCSHCVFSSNIKSRYDIHILTKKHKMHVDSAHLYTHVCKNCNKKFRGQSGLCMHKSKCKVIPEPTPNISTQSIKDAVKECMNEFKDDIKHEIIANKQPTNITNNQHNTFNVNLFLNENATQAKNFIDMIQNISVKGPYPEQISSENYVSSVVKLITNEIDKLPIDERPIHCIKNEDENQKILHIRHDDTWKKEIELDWTSQIHNYFHDTGEEPSPEEEKIIFNGIKQLEENIKTEIEKLNNVLTKREYKSELGHPPNRVNIIKCLLDYVNIEKDQLLQIVEKAYKKRNTQINT